MGEITEHFWQAQRLAQRWPDARRRVASAIRAGGRDLCCNGQFDGGGARASASPSRSARAAPVRLNYPTLLAEELRLTLFDATCSGATTEHILGPWGEIPAQIEMVTAETDLVTITIGGNDINYVGNIMAASCPPGGKFEVAGRTFDCPKPTDPSEVDYAMLEDSLGRIAQEVRRRAPDAKIVFVEYLRLVPETSCANTPLSEEGAAATREIARRLALATRNAAKANSAQRSDPRHVCRPHRLRRQALGSRQSGWLRRQRRRALAPELRRNARCCGYSGGAAQDLTGTVTLTLLGNGDLVGTRTVAR
ncbi:MAG: GDSL-type esterase/lipase family protein [Sphingomonadaceae bacterium]